MIFCSVVSVALAISPIASKNRKDVVRAVLSPGQRPSDRTTAANALSSSVFFFRTRRACRPSGGLQSTMSWSSNDARTWLETRPRRHDFSPPL